MRLGWERGRRERLRCPWPDSTQESSEKNGELAASIAHMRTKLMESAESNRGRCCYGESLIMAFPGLLLRQTRACRKARGRLSLVEERDLHVVSGWVLS